MSYHYGKFPPRELEYQALADPLAGAAAAVARYEQMLTGIHNTSLFLSPLERQEALSSSRMEGTISTLDELLVYEANLDQSNRNQLARKDTLEVHAYRIAMNRAEMKLSSGQSFSPDLLCSVHRDLLGFTRGRDKSPGEWKTEQNYLVDMVKREILFVPISPDNLTTGIQTLFQFIRNSKAHPLLKTAISHVEFESLHPFNDGNGRVGRIMITLMMWAFGVISRPYFYISGYLEKEKDAYIDCMRTVSASGDWTPWCIFFLGAVQAQAEANLIKSDEIRELYENMKEAFRENLSSKWTITALDFMFTNPIFRNNQFTKNSGIPYQTANRFTNVLTQAGLLRIILPPSGNRAGLYAFEPLLSIIRT